MPNFGKRLLMTIFLQPSTCSSRAVQHSPVDLAISIKMGVPAIKYKADQDVAKTEKQTGGDQYIYTQYVIQ